MGSSKRREEYFSVGACHDFSGFSLCQLHIRKPPINGIALQDENAQLVRISEHLGRAAFCTASGRIGLLQLNYEIPCVEVYDTLAGETLTTLVFHNKDAKLFVGTESGMVYRFDFQVLESALIFVPRVSPGMLLLLGQRGAGGH